MGAFPALGILCVAACLEAGGDAIVRAGLHDHTRLVRLALFATGALVLFLYGVTVNSPPWDFGRLLGIYVTLFFVAAQVINLVAFRVRPALSTWVGGSLIVCGGLLMTFWRV